MLKPVFIWVFCLWQTNVFAQSFFENAAHAYFSLHNYSKWQPQIIAAGYNPAAFANLAQNALFVYAEQRFLLQELSTYRTGAGLKTHAGVWGLQGAIRGNTSYRNTSGTLSYGRQLNERISVGLGFEYQVFRIKGYEHTGFVNINAGTTIKLTENLRSGISVNRLPAYRINNHSDSPGPVFQVTFGYDFSQQVYGAIGFEKAGEAPNDVQFLLVYRLRENLQVKGGVASAAPVYFGGISFSTGKINIDCLSSYHPYLGITPGLSVQFNLGKKTGEPAATAQ